MFVDMVAVFKGYFYLMLSLVVFDEVVSLVQVCPSARKMRKNYDIWIAYYFDENHTNLLSNLTCNNRTHEQNLELTHANLVCIQFTSTHFSTTGHPSL